MLFTNAKELIIRSFFQVLGGWILKIIHIRISFVSCLQLQTQRKRGYTSNHIRILERKIREKPGGISSQIYENFEED
jgi:hypothetical protein